MPGDSPTDFSTGPAAGDPLFARASAVERVELRGLTDRWIADVLDAVCYHQGGKQRMELVNEILHAWAKGKVDEANVIHSVTRRNGSRAETDGGARG